MGLLNRLRGEEPGYFKKLSVQWKEGTGGLGEYLTEYALEHGDLPGRKAVFRNVLVPRSTGPTGESEVDVLLRRIGRYGEFLGCANYPKCRYTRGV